MSIDYCFNFPNDGLGSRLKVINCLGYLYYNHNSKLSVHWPVNYQCSAHFTELFQNVCNMSFSEKRFEPDQCRDFKTDVINDAIHQEHQIRHGFIEGEVKNPLDSYYKKVLVPSAEVSGLAHSLINKYNITKDVIGIHIRVPEGQSYHSNQIHLNNCSGILRALGEIAQKNIQTIRECEWLKDYRVCFMSDNKDLVSSMLSAYKNFFTIEENVFPDHKKFPPIRSKESVKSSLAIAYCLSRTNYKDKFIFYTRSSYSSLPTKIELL